MMKFRLSRNEKTALRSIALGYGCVPDGMSEQSFSMAVASLQQLGLVDAVFASGHVVVDAMLTERGVAYLNENPSLRNPINWAVVGAVASAIAAIAALAVLFVSCAKINL